MESTHFLHPARVLQVFPMFLQYQPAWGDKFCSRLNEEQFLQEVVHITQVQVERLADQEPLRLYPCLEDVGRLNSNCHTGLQVGALLALSFGEKYKHRYGAHKAHKYRLGVLNLLCANTAKVFVVPVVGEQLLGSPTASFSGPGAGYWKTCWQTQSQSIPWLCREGSFLSVQSEVCGCQTSPRESWRQYHGAGLPQPWTWPGENADCWLVYGIVYVREVLIL